MRNFTTAAAVLIALAGCASTMPGVPLPPDLRVAAADANLPRGVRGFAGKWTGQWISPWGRLDHVLAIEEITAHEAKVVYANGALITSQGSGIDPGWFRTTGRFDAEGRLTLNLRSGAKASYRLQPDGTLRGAYEGRGPAATATMARSPS